MARSFVLGLEKTEQTKSGQLSFDLAKLGTPIHRVFKDGDKVEFEDELERINFNYEYTAGIENYTLQGGKIDTHANIELHSESEGVWKTLVNIKQPSAFNLSYLNDIVEIFNVNINKGSLVHASFYTYKHENQEYYVSSRLQKFAQLQSIDYKQTIDVCETNDKSFILYKK